MNEDPSIGTAVSQTSRQIGEAPSTIARFNQEEILQDIAAAQDQQPSGAKAQDLLQDIENQISVAQGYFTSTLAGETYGDQNLDRIEIALAYLQDLNLSNNPNAVKDLINISAQLMSDRAFDLSEIRAVYQLLEQAKQGSAAVEELNQLRDLTVKTLQARQTTRTAVAQGYHQGLINNQEIQAFQQSVLITDIQIQPSEFIQLIKTSLETQQGFFHNMDPQSQNFGDAFKYSRILPAIELISQISETGPYSQEEQELIKLTAQKLYQEKSFQASDERLFALLLNKVSNEPADQVAWQQLRELTLKTLELKMVKAPELAIMLSNGMINARQVHDIMSGRASLADYAAGSRGSSASLSSGPTQIDSPWNIRPFLAHEFSNNATYDEEIALLNALIGDSGRSYSTKSAQGKHFLDTLSDILSEYAEVVEKLEKKEIAQEEAREQVQSLIATISDTLAHLNVDAVQIDHSMIVTFGNPDNPLTFNVSTAELVRVANSLKRTVPLDLPLSDIITPDDLFG